MACVGEVRGLGEEDVAESHAAQAFGPEQGAADTARSEQDELPGAEMRQQRVDDTVVMLTRHHDRDDVSIGDYGRVCCQKRKRSEMSPDAAAEVPYPAFDTDAPEGAQRSQALFELKMLVQHDVAAEERELGRKGAAAIASADDGVTGGGCHVSTCW